MEEKNFDETFLDEIRKVNQLKRSFLKKVLIGTVFAVPVVQSYSMKDFKPKVPAAWAS